jgi:predicted DNA-binding transcriptional regulator AlpA
VTEQIFFEGGASAFLGLLQTIRDGGNTAALTGWKKKMALPKRLITVTETIEYLGITKDTWDKWRAKGKAPHVRRLPNGTLRVTEEELEIWVESLERV